MQYKNILGLYLSLWITFSSCNKFVEPDFPNNQLSSENVYADNIAATSAMAGLYYRMIHSTGVFNGSVNSPGFLAGLSSDELLPAGSTGEIIQFAENNIITTNTSIASLWSGAYNYIFLANSIIEGAERSSALDSSLRRQLIGEAKFIRAFSHFYLQNLFGNVPYIKSTDYRVNTAAPRMDSTQVYTNMIEDLEAAYELLPDNFDAGGGEKIRVTKWAAAAMLARVYLYAGNWAEAERNATLIIENTGLFSLSTLTDAFLKNSTESIWQLKSVMPTRNTLEGFTFIPTGVPLYAYLRPSFADDFEDGDLRKTYWVGTIIVDAITYQWSLIKRK